MRRTAITVNYLQMLCLLVVLSSFFEELLLVVGVLLFFEEFTLFVGVLVCLFSSKSCSACCVICFWLLRRVALHVVLSAFGLFEGLLYLWGCLAC